MNSRINLANLKSLMGIDPENLSFSLEGFIRGYMEKLEREGIILGLSGGIDSAVTAALCKRAVGAEKVLALIMPEKDSEERHRKDALHFARELNIEARLIDISTYLRKFGSYKLFPLNKIPIPGKLKNILTKKAFKFYDRKTGETLFSASVSGFKDKAFGSYLAKGNAYYRIKHRVRMVLLYLYGEIENRLIVGAANKTEYKVGFFVKHGCDAAVDIMPILGLYKTQVRELARYLNIPSNITEKSPSPDIIPGIIDEEAIGIPYEKLDLILLALENRFEIPEIADMLGIGEKQVLYVRNLTLRSEHMRKVYAPEAATIIKSFGDYSI